MGGIYECGEDRAEDMVPQLGTYVQHPVARQSGWLYLATYPHK